MPQQPSGGRRLLQLGELRRFRPDSPQLSGLTASEAAEAVLCQSDDMGSIVEEDGSEEEEAVPPHATEELQVRTLQAGARTVEVEIPDAGPLGMSLASDSAAGRPWVSSIKPGGRIAARPGVKVGMLLLAVDGQVRLASNADASN